LFGIPDLNIECRIQRGTFKTRFGAPYLVTNLTSFVKSAGRLEPLGVGNYTCKFRGRIIMEGDDTTDLVESATVFFVVEYTSPLAGRRVKMNSPVFTLEKAAIPPRWEVGPSLN